MPPPLTYIKAGLLLNASSASVQPILGIERQFSRNFAASFYTTTDLRDRFIGFTLRPSLLMHPNRNVSASLFIEAGGGYFLNGTRARGGTEGLGLNSSIGVEICPQIVGLHTFCTSFLYQFNWIEQSVLHHTVTDQGWYFDNVLKIGISIGFNV